jgi:hypothetical protein
VILLKVAVFLYLWIASSCHIKFGICALCHAQDINTVGLFECGGMYFSVITLLVPLGLPCNLVGGVHNVVDI